MPSSFNVESFFINELEYFSVKDLQTLGAAETKLLYTLHWILLFAAEECADEDMDNIKRSNEKRAPYLFSIPTISVDLMIPVNKQIFLIVFFSQSIVVRLFICSDCTSLKRV